MAGKKVESLEQVVQICQKSAGQQKSNWFSQCIAQCAYPITWLILHTPITATQIRLIALVTGLTGISFLISPSILGFLLASLFFQIWYLLDQVAVQMTEYRRLASFTDRFFYLLIHRSIEMTVVFGISYYAFLLTGIPLLILWGFLASIAILLLNLLTDMKFKIFFEIAPTGLPKFTVATLRESIQKIKERRGQEVVKNLDLRNLAKTLLFFFRETCESYALIGILTACAIAETIIKLPLDFRLALLLFYGTVIPAIAIIELIRLVLSADSQP